MSCLQKLNLINELGSELVTFGEIVVPTKYIVNTPKNYAPRKVKDLFEKIKILDQDKFSNKIEIKKVQMEIENNNDIFSDVSLIYLYLKMGNQTRANNIIEKIVSKEIFKFGFEMNIPISFRQEILNELIELLKKIDQIILNKKLFNIFVLHLYENTDHLIQEKLSDIFIINYSNKEFLKMSQSINYGLSFPNVWFPILQSNFSLDEAENFLVHSNFYKKLNKNKFEHFYILEKYFPNDKNQREIIRTAIQEIEKNQQPYFQDLLFRVLSNEELKLYLVQKDSRYTKPLFSRKRKHYLNLLKQGIAIDYALFQLIKLGDYNPTYLFYLQSK